MSKSKAKAKAKANSVLNAFEDFSAWDTTSYEHDDTPKAFKRLMQFKNKLTEKKNTPKPTPTLVSSFSKPKPSTSTPAETNSASSNAQSLIKFAEAGSKLSAKRKAYQKKRDERKRAKKQKSSLERDYQSSRTVIKSVRDIVQEPPKLLVKPKKVFKKEVQRGDDETDSELELSGFSDFDEDAVDFSDLD